jgi:hypothetical protein
MMGMFQSGGKYIQTKFGFSSFVPSLGAYPLILLQT